MPPHNGAGASQAAEDAYILAEVLTSLVEMEEQPSTTSVEVALKAFEEMGGYQCMPRRSR